MAIYRDFYAYDYILYGDFTSTRHVCANVKQLWHAEHERIKTDTSRRLFVRLLYSHKGAVYRRAFYVDCVLDLYVKRHH